MPQAVPCSTQDTSMHTHHSGPGFSLLKKLPSLPPSKITIVISTWWIWGDFNFLLPYLFFPPHSIMCFPWNKRTTYYSYLCDNQTPAFYSTFVTHLYISKQHLFSFACFEIL